jgi:hypothetical protein
MEEVDERTEQMARAIYAEYGTMNDWPTDWGATDGTIHDDTRAKYLAIADYVMDKIEWTSFTLIRRSDDDQTESAE